MPSGCSLGAGSSSRCFARAIPVGRITSAYVALRSTGSGVGWDTHDDGADVLIWQFDTGDVEVVGALERLASTLSLLEAPPDAHASGHVVAGLTVT
jgi:hypothetical protein